MGCGGDPSFGVAICHDLVDCETEEWVVARVGLNFACFARLVADIMSRRWAYRGKMSK
jgi:hypothetical protein